MNAFLHFFMCKWETVTSQPMLRKQMHPFTFEVLDPEGPAEPVTQVLQRCVVCGKLKTRTLSGRWTMNDLMGERNATA